MINELLKQINFFFFVHIIRLQQINVWIIGVLLYKHFAKKLAHKNKGSMSNYN